MTEAERPFRITIRPMKLEDIEQAHELDMLSFSLPWPERSFRYEVTSNPNSRCWVAEMGTTSRIVGMIVIWLIVDEAHIGTLAVHPDYRRQKIASRLMAQALLNLTGEGACSASLEVRRSNEAALTLYQRFGFEIVGVRSRYYVDNHEDAILMDLKDMGRMDRLHTLKSFLEVAS